MPRGIGDNVLSRRRRLTRCIYLYIIPFVDRKVLFGRDVSCYSHPLYVCVRKIFLSLLCLLPLRMSSRSLSFVSSLLFSDVVDDDVVKLYVSVPLQNTMYYVPTAGSPIPLVLRIVFRPIEEKFSISIS